MSNIKTAIRNKLSSATVTALLIIKANNASPCYEFVPTNDMIDKTKSATYKHLKALKGKTPSSGSSTVTDVVSMSVDDDDDADTSKQHSASDSSNSSEKRVRKAPKTLKDYMLA